MTNLYNPTFQGHPSSKTIMRWHKGMEAYFWERETFAETEARLEMERQTHAANLAAEIADQEAMYEL